MSTFLFEFVLITLSFDPKFNAKKKGNENKSLVRFPKKKFRYVHNKKDDNQQRRYKEEENEEINNKQNKLSKSRTIAPNEDLEDKY